jgi:mRNA-degrading endonuclease YafQ of YafQ-DinJ toxin-antitoxin module
MTAASWALQRSIYQALAGSAELTSLLGGEHIYSNPPPAAEFPYITLGQTVNLDWSTGTEDGNEHSLTLHVWSRADSAIEVHEIIQVIRMLLHNQPLSLEDHFLVNMRHEFTEARIDPDGETMHGIVRYRAVTEPAQQAAA